jgi:biopolymer transport protein ExbD/biopolymer transport protein TolR
MRRKQTIFNEINITPLTDIFLVLLIIMMVVAPMLDTKGLKLDVPSVAPDANVTQQPKTMNIRLDANNQLTFNEQRIASDKAQLIRTIQQKKSDFPEGVFIQPDDNSSHETLTMVLDAAQTAGVTKVSIKGDSP